MAPAPLGCELLRRRRPLGTPDRGPRQAPARSQEAREFVRALELKNEAAWRAWSRGELVDLPPRPRNVPSNPSQAYPDEWAGLGDWLGTGTLHWSQREYLSFEDARAFARRLGLGAQKDWRAWCAGKRPDLPGRPENVPTQPPAPAT